MFPCGSITGAPKIRTMQIIRELERFPRGAYTGAIGFLKPGGDCVFNVAIRTVVIDTETNVATFGVGGGVTIDSTAEREYEECLVKSRFLHTSPVEFQLFESILLEDGEYFLLDAASRAAAEIRRSTLGLVFRKKRSTRPWNGCRECCWVVQSTIDAVEGRTNRNGDFTRLRR